MATRRPYPTDLTDEQWHILEPMIPREKHGGRHRTMDMREVVNAILYILRTGCQWRNLPHDFPPWGTVAWYFWLWSNDGTWTRIHDKLRELVRGEAGRESEPSAAIMDSQSVKTTEVGGPKGYDAAKKVTGRKRHLLVDTMGLILLVIVHPADVQDRDGATSLLSLLVGRFPRLQLIWADGGYAGHLVAWVMLTFESRLRLEIVRRTEEHRFSVVRHRWIVERTFGWLGRCRRLSKDYEALTGTSEDWIRLAMIGVMIRRLTPASFQPT
jgi:putative transposase